VYKFYYAFDAGSWVGFVALIEWNICIDGWIRRARDSPPFFKALVHGRFKTQLSRCNPPSNLHTKSSKAI
jgi:hypothetical protein